MPPSRRATIGAVLTALAAHLAGCTAPATSEDGGSGGSGGSGGDDGNDGSDENGESGGSGRSGGNGGNGSSTPGGSGESTLEVRLRGPETDRHLFDGTDVASVGTIRNRSGSFRLPITLTDGATEDVAGRFRAAGVPETPGEFEVVQFHDGEEVGRFGIAPGLAAEIGDGEWNGELLLTFARREQATELRETLMDGDE